MSKTNIKVKLVGKDDNAFFILGTVVHAMRRGGVDKETIDKYQEEAMSGDYGNVLRVTMEYVDVE